MRYFIIVVTASVGLFSGCAKEQIRPISADSTADSPLPIEKELGNTKRRMWCGLFNGKEFVAEGTICQGSGNECGRGSYCTAKLGLTDDPDAIVFEGMTRKAFIDLWNTEDGMHSLMEKGVYAVTEP